jgi:hypothetical protein
MEVIYYPITLLVDHPTLAFVPATVFAIFYLTYRRRLRTLGRPYVARALFGAAVMWLLYGFYEMHMQQWSHTVVAPIRVDLLLITPVLYIGTAVGISGCWRAQRLRS